MALDVVGVGAALGVAGVLEMPGALPGTFCLDRVCGVCGFTPVPGTTDGVDCRQAAKPLSRKERRGASTPAISGRQTGL